MGVRVIRSFTCILYSLGNSHPVDYDKQKKHKKCMREFTLPNLS